MRNPRLFKFLAWFGPAMIAAVWAVPLGIAQMGQTWPGVATWAEGVFSAWWPVVTAPLFLITMVVLGLAYVAALVFAGSAPAVAPSPQAALEDYRRDLIKQLRSNVVVNARHDKKHLKAYLEGHTLFPAVRKHLSPEFLAELDGSGMTVWAMGDNSVLTPLEKKFLAELDRLETKWGLD